MTDNEKIAKWAGLGNWLDYKNKDQDAVLLLPVLFRKNLFVDIRIFTAPLMGDVPENEYYRCDIMSENASWYALDNTFSHAVSAAGLKLIADKP